VGTPSCSRAWAPHAPAAYERHRPKRLSLIPEARGWLRPWQPINATVLARTSANSDRVALLLCRAFRTTQFRLSTWWANVAAGCLPAINTSNG